MIIQHWCGAPNDLVLFKCIWIYYHPVTVIHAGAQRHSLLWRNHSSMESARFCLKMSLFTDRIQEKKTRQNQKQSANDTVLQVLVLFLLSGLTEKGDTGFCPFSNSVSSLSVFSVCIYIYV